MLDLANKNTGNAHGDTSFVLSKKTNAYQCRQDPFSQELFVKPPGNSSTKPCKYIRADAEQQHFFSGVVYHHCHGKHVSVVFKPCRMPEQQDRYVATMQLVVERAGYQGKMIYRGLQLSGQEVFKRVALPLTGAEILCVATETVMSQFGSSFDYTSPQQIQVYLAQGKDLITKETGFVIPPQEQEQKQQKRNREEEMNAETTPQRRRVMSKQAFCDPLCSDAPFEAIQAARRLASQ